MHPRRKLPPPLALVKSGSAASTRIGNAALPRRPAHKPKRAPQPSRPSNGRVINLPTTREHAQTRVGRPAGSTDAKTYAAGDIIASKYKLTRIIGEGGMGAVWLARNLLLDVDVAVKLILSQMSTPDTSKRLLIEARAAARIEHPSIVRIFDFGETEHGDPFIVMEVVRGESLADVLERKVRLPVLNAVQLMLPIASALSAAHSRGVVHRDLKPDNIILLTQAKGHINPKLVDFGIAKVEENSKGLTQVGTMLGSPDYMSPELIQATGDVDERTDVWAFSVVLYEAMAGRMPFQGGSQWELFKMVMYSDPMPTTDFGAGDDALWQIIRRGLAKKHSERWPSMGAMGKALAQWAHRAGARSDIAGTDLAMQWLSEGVLRALSCPPVTHGLERIAIAPQPRIIPSVLKRPLSDPLPMPLLSANPATDPSIVTPPTNTPSETALDDIVAATQGAVNVRKRRALLVALAFPLAIGLIVLLLGQQQQSEYGSAAFAPVVASAGEVTFIIKRDARQKKEAAAEIKAAEERAELQKAIAKKQKRHRRAR